MAEKKPNPFSGKMRDAYEKGRGEETTVQRFGDLPPGITGGIARLHSAVFQKYATGDNKGQYFFMAQAIVLEPVEVFDKKGNKLSIKGLRTKVGPLPMCKTKNRSNEVTSEDENVARVLNELRKLGVDTENTEPEDIPQVVADLVEEHPCIKFDTWARTPTEKYPDPIINHNWLGLTDDVVADDDEDDEDEDNSETGKKLKEKEKPNKPKKKPIHKVDLKKLADQADNGDEDAQRKIVDLAEVVGYTEEDCLAAPSWGDVVKMIAKPKKDEGDEDDTEDDEEGGEGDEEDTEGDEKPIVGDVYNFTPVDEATGKPGKMMKVKVVNIDEVKETCSVKTVKGDKLMKNIDWDRLGN